MEHPLTSKNIDFEIQKHLFTHLFDKLTLSLYTKRVYIKFIRYTTWRLLRDVRAVFIKLLVYVCAKFKIIFVHETAFSFCNTDAHYSSVINSFRRLFATYKFKHSAILSIAIESFLCSKKKKQKRLRIFVGMLVYCSLCFALVDHTKSCFEHFGIQNRQKWRNSTSLNIIWSFYFQL